MVRLVLYAALPEIWNLEVLIARSGPCIDNTDSRYVSMMIMMVGISYLPCGRRDKMANILKENQPSRWQEILTAQLAKHTQIVPVICVFRDSSSSLQHVANIHLNQQHMQFPTLSRL
jgi:hypothetical protein